MPGCLPAAAGSRWRTYTGCVPRSVPEAQHQLPADTAYARSPRRAAQAATAGLARIPAHRHRHQGDQDGCKVYHINAVDEVTQWEIVRRTADLRTLAAAVLEAILQQFPFVIRASIRQRQRVHQLHRGPVAGETTHRTDPVAAAPFRDNACRVQERAIIRKHIGYATSPRNTPRRWIGSTGVPQPVPNFHRPACAHAPTQANGKRRDLPRWATPLELFRNCLLRALPAPRRHPAELESFAQLQSDTEPAGHAVCQAQAAGSVKRTQTA